MVAVSSYARYVCESRGMLTVDVEKLNYYQLADLIQEDIEEHEGRNDKPQPQQVVVAEMQPHEVVIEDVQPPRTAVEEVQCQQVATEEVQPQQMTVGESQPQEWPPDDRWHFQPGEAAFLRVRFPVSGKPALLLKFLAESRRGVTLKEMTDAVSPETQIQDGTLRGYLSDLRKLLRTTYTIAESDDPIPQVDVAPKAAWKLDSQKLSIQRISSDDSDRNPARDS